VIDRRDAWTLAGLLLLPFVWYAAPVFTELGLYIGDLTAQYRPWWSYAHESLRAGRLPLWNPHVFGGMPYHVNPENSLFYPLKLPLFSLSFFKAAALLRVLNAMVASAGTYVLLRSLGTRASVATVGALMFTYGSFMSYKFLHIPYVNTAVWFPWQLLLLRRLIRRPAGWVSPLFAMVTAASFLGGSPGVFIVCQLTLGFFLLFETVRLAVARRWRRLGRLASNMVLSVALVVGLTLILLLPAAQFIPLTPRADGLAERSTLSDFVLTSRGLEALVFPYAHYAFGAPYPPLHPIHLLNVPHLGVAAVLLALFNLGSRRSSHILLASVPAMVFGVSMAMGTRTAFLPALAGNLPVFGWFRWPHDYLLMVYLLLPILAATGLERLLRASSPERRGLAGLALLYLISGLFWLRHPVALTALLAAAGVVLLGLLLTRLAAHIPRLGWLPAALVMLGVGLELYVFSSSYRIHERPEALNLTQSAAMRYLQQNAGIDRVAVSAAGYGTHFRGQERLFQRQIPLVTGTSGGVLDFDGWLRQRDVTTRSHGLWARKVAFDSTGLSGDVALEPFPVNAAMILGYQEVSGYDPFHLDRVDRLYRALPQPRTWDLLGVRWVVAANRIAHEQLRHVLSDDRLHVYENRTRHPRAFVARTSEHGLSADEILARLADDDFDPERAVLFEQETGPGTPFDVQSSRSTSPGTVAVLDYAPERVTLVVELERPAWVVLNDIHHPDWKAYAAGQTLPVRRANYTFRAVHVPAGHHRVELVYEPTSFYVSALISTATWLACLAVVTVAVLSRHTIGVRSGAQRFEHVASTSG